MDDTLNSLLQANRSGSVLQGIANPPQVNPLAAINSANQAAEADYRVRGLQAKLAWGNILQQSTDENGNVDYGKAQSLAARNPVAALGMRSALESNATLQGQQLIQASAAHSFLGNLAVSAVQDPSDENMANIRAQAVNAKAPPQVLAEIDRISGLPQAQRSQVALQHVFSNVAALDKMHALVGQTTMQQTGGQISPLTVTQPGLTGRPGTLSVGGGGATLGLTPDQLAQPHNYTDANGVTHQTTLGEYLKSLGVPVPTGGGQVGGAPGAGAQRSGAAPQPQSPPTQQAQSGKSIPAPEPGMEEKWKASAQAYNADNADAGTYQQRVFPLVQAASILKSGDVTTGKGAEAINSIKSHLMTVATSLGADAQTIQQADFDKLAKYMQQYVNLQGLSGRSDQAMASAISGNPSAHISTLANQQILPAMIGMERMKQMIISDFTNSGGKPNQYSDYKTNWQNTHDPRAFIFDMMDNDQRSKMVAGMTPSQKLAFSRTLDQVERNPGIMGQATMPGH